MLSLCWRAANSRGKRERKSGGTVVKTHPTDTYIVLCRICKVVNVYHHPGLGPAICLACQTRDKYMPNGWYA